MNQPEQPGSEVPGRGSQPPLPRSVSELQGLVANLRSRLAEAERALENLRGRQAESGADHPGAAPSQEPPACIPTEARVAEGPPTDRRPGEPARRAPEPQDNLIQTIFGIGLELEECKRLIEQDRPAVIATVDRAIAGLNDVIREVRTHMLASLAEEAPREQPTRPAN